MDFLVWFLAVASCFKGNECAEMDNQNGPLTNPPYIRKKTSDPSVNLSDPVKDMYVIRATVYQIGILTNNTDNITDNFNSTGNQESLTLYHRNGSKVDLSAIPEPFLTNVTAQTLVGVAPITDIKGENSLGAWGALNQLTQHEASTDDKENLTTKSTVYKDFLRLYKRETERTPVKVVNGTTIIPSDAAIQSISLPPLLSLNNNLTEIPVPIPNTAIVHYAKVNTLFQKP